VTTTGDLPHDHEERLHDASAWAWLDYNGRILEYEIAGYLRDDEEHATYGRRWACDLYRGTERINVAIERK